MERAIHKYRLSFDVVHQHGIWTGVSRTLNRWRTLTGRPTIISPQGALEPWALRRSRWKKSLALMLYERQNLHKVSCMQALSIQEASDFRSFGFYGPIVIIPNGISEAWMLQCSDAVRFRLQYGLTDDMRIMLFLGRITPKKGLPMLLQAMRRHHQHLEGWKLMIVGVDEFNHQLEVQGIVRELALQPYVQFVGPQFDQDKRDAFSAADVFILPSHSEGAPIAILEALGAGVPVFTTKASPWEELITHHCGWWTDISVEAIADALKDVMQGPQMQIRSKRYGSIYGGWSVAVGSLNADSIVYSVGIGEDITFDLALIDIYGLTVHAFDPTPRSIEWLRTQRLPDGFVLHPIGLADFDGKAAFYAPSNPAYASYSMVHKVSQTSSDTAHSDVQCLGSIMRQLEHRYVSITLRQFLIGN